MAFALMIPVQIGHAADASPDGIWNPRNETEVARTAQARQIVPQRYRTIALSRAALEQALQIAPMEQSVSASRSAARLWLPLPDGRFGEFRIVESPIMEPALAQRYPELRTWLGQGVDDPTATVRFDLTPKGFHAQIISAHGTSYVDPYQPGDVENYIVYAKHDLIPGERMRCEVTGEELTDDDLHLHDHAGEVRLSSGATLRTYRLAMAATGEYTIFHGGSVADGLAGIVTTMNRVNGIYEREVSVRMVLVANNDQIIYTNPATDPYTNTSSDLNANQANITAVIGSANYDVGHLVGTGGGGVAGLGVVCNNSNKARGLTGRGAPISDPFDVDYVAHEIGHQFRGNHTFNGSGGSCSGGNRNGATAYEPGSGITIQAYAGICGADNLQPNSEDYFHRVSLNEIIAFTTSGGGASCAATSVTGNTVPAVTTPSAITIPQRTPFELDAIGSDADGDSLTYLWEQFNLGSANTAGSLIDNNGPLFRSFAPGTDSSRTFPSLRYILNNANVAPNSTPLPGTASPNFFTAELLPSIERTMNFRVTVRDNRAGGGGTNEAASAITVTTSAGPFAVTAPNTAETWPAGTQQTVNWDVAGTDTGVVSTADVRIRLSLDGGFSWPVELASSVPNNGTALVDIPADTPASTRARVRVEAVGNIYFDVSDVDFTVTGANTPPSIVVTGPVTTQQGTPSSSAVVANISDVQDDADALEVSVSGAPPGLQVDASSEAGAVTLTAAASCTLVAPTNGTRSYPVLLRATDTAGASSTAFVNVNVAANQAPTLGMYPDLGVSRNELVQTVPAVPAQDGNGNLSAIIVTPTTLPGGGTLFGALADGAISIQTTLGTTPDVYMITVQAIDTCGATSTTRSFALTVDSAALPGVTVTQDGDSTDVTEGGESDSYSIALDSEPAGDVIITINADANLSLDSDSLTFTNSNWSTPQTVVVSAVDDRIVEGTHTGAITHTPSGGGYDNVAIADVVVTISDNDSAVYQFTAASSSAEEAAGSVAIDVSIAFDTIGTGENALTQPLTIPFVEEAASTAVGNGVDYSLATANVVIPVDGSTQSIAVTIIDNTVADGDRELVLTLGTASSGDTALDAMLTLGAPASHVLTIFDNEAVGVSVVESDGTTNVSEDGASDTYTIALISQPAVDVVIAISADPQLNVEPSELTFTGANWNIAQTVTVTAVDDDAIEGDQTVLITHAATGGAYTDVPIPGVLVNISDNDLIADIAISNVLLSAPVLAGQSILFEVTINNLSTVINVPLVAFDFSITPALDNIEWTCVATERASCPPSGSGLPQQSVVLGRESGVLYSIMADVPEDSVAGNAFVATASVGVDLPYVDSNSANDAESAIVTISTIGIFEDGFEEAPPAR